MPSFDVVAASKKKEVEGQRGLMQVVALTLAQEGQASPVVAEWFTRASTPLPVPGTKLDGDLEDTQWGKKFRKAQQNGFGGGRQRDPATEKRIVHQHSQGVAIETLCLAREMGIEIQAGSVNELVTLVETVAGVYDRKAWDAA